MTEQRQVLPMEVLSEAAALHVLRASLRKTAQEKARARWTLRALWRSQPPQCNAEKAAGVVRRTPGAGGRCGDKRGGIATLDASWPVFRGRAERLSQRV